MAKYPHAVQLCLLFDESKPLDLTAFVSDFVQSETAAGTKYNVPEQHPNFFRLYDGANDLMLTFELMPNRAQDAVFERALAANYNMLLAPDAADRIKRHKSHILIGVHHGVFPDLGDQMTFLEQIGALPGQTLELFRKRLAVAEHAAVKVMSAAPASLVHQTLFNILAPGPVYAAIVTHSITPHMMQIHPYVYSAERNRDGSWNYGYRTVGATCFIDREIYLAPNHVAWAESVENILTFIRMALLENGYIIPDGDTFGPADNSMSYRVTHIPEGQKADEFDGPLYRLDLIMHKATSFESPAYVKPVRTFDDRTIPPDIKADLGRSLAQEQQRLRARRETAEKAGAGFHVRTSAADPKDEPPARRGLRRWFPFFRGK